MFSQIADTLLVSYRVHILQFILPVLFLFTKINDSKIPQAINKIYITNSMYNFMSSLLLQKMSLIFEKVARILSIMFIITSDSTF